MKGKAFAKPGGPDSCRSRSNGKLGASLFSLKDRNMFTGSGLRCFQLHDGTLQIAAEIAALDSHDRAKSNAALFLLHFGALAELK